jgi:AcrR family transcriptional regulator
MTKEITQKQDTRYKLTESYIFEAIHQILSRKPFEKISIKDIAERAGISRSAFYLHFQDKYDLIDTYQKQLSAKVKEIPLPTDPSERQAYLEALISVVFVEHKLFSLIFGESGNHEIQQKILAYIRENVKETIISMVSIDVQSDAEADYLIVYLTSATFGVIQTWIQNGMQESPQEMACILDKLIPAYV